MAKPRHGERGNEVILPFVTYVGAADAVVCTGATPVLCDVHPGTLNATAEGVA